MTDAPRTFQRGEFVVSTDRTRLDVPLIHDFLRESYWAAGIPRSVVETAIANSVCFGVYHGERQVGFARAISDLATYAYLSDVFIVPEYRGRGLGQWLVRCILDHPEVGRVRRMALFTRDAQGLYERFGFGPAASRSTYMEIRVENPYGS